MSHTFTNAHLYAQRKVTRHLKSEVKITDKDAECNFTIFSLSLVRNVNRGVAQAIFMTRKSVRIQWDFSLQNSVEDIANRKLCVQLFVHLESVEKYVYGNIF